MSYRSNQTLTDWLRSLLPWPATIGAKGSDQPFLLAGKASVYLKPVCPYSHDLQAPGTRDQARQKGNAPPRLVRLVHRQAKAGGLARVRSLFDGLALARAFHPAGAESRLYRHFSMD